MTSSTTSDEAGAPRKSALPMALTLTRLALAPIVAGLILAAGYGVFTLGVAFAGWAYAAAAALFAVAALTDWFDGRLARKLDAVSPLGAALDHVADKALTAAALMALAATVMPFDLVLAAMILVVRDLVIGGLREGLPGHMPVDAFGKIKAAAAMGGVTLYLAFQAAAHFGAAPVAVLEGLVWGGRTLIWMAALLSLASAGRYAASAFARRD